MLTLVTGFLSVVVALAAVVLLLPTASDLVSLVRLALRRDRAPTQVAAKLERFLFLVPAHNEELLIEACVRSLLDLRYPSAHATFVVIADNCTDRTAEIVRGLGVRCLERRDPVNPGKPFAIAWALQQVSLDGVDGVVIVDADSIVHPDFATGLAAAAPVSDKALQCYNDVSNPRENALTRMAAVFSAVRCRHINEFKRFAGLNSSLGNGLCLGTNVLRRVGWNAFSISEDSELYAMLTRDGIHIESAVAARIFSQEARSLGQSASQRRRWAAGNSLVLRRYGWQLARSERIGFAQKLDSIAELTCPGPAVHLGIVAGLCAATFLLRLPGAPFLAAGVGFSLVRPLTYTSIAVWSDPDPTSAMLAFSFLPFYTVWRLGVQAGAVMAVGKQSWVRTERHAQPDRRS